MVVKLKSYKRKPPKDRWLFLVHQVRKRGHEIKDYSKAIELKPNFTRAYLNRALAYSFLKEYDKGIADYNKLVEIKPSDLKLIIDNRAELYFEKGDYDNTWADVEKAKSLGVTVNKDFIEKLEKASKRQN